MPPVDDLKSEVARIWGAAPAAKLCLKIIDFVASLPAEQVRMLTFSNLCRVVGKRAPDGDLLTAVTILVSSKIHALDTHTLFIDDNQAEHEIDPEDLRDAKLSGTLVHPVSGELVSNYEAHLVPFFVPSPKLRGIVDAQHD
ncbi:hypothetical protein [Roseomonas xinghualingensis]|uniref:hypothetical protein n=1 Tax=Roseomonas xinghualingensis TaxID=2986475 RepID=UPI0021F0EEB3|nr:hypothetical protein [Roseomonas sp. SXEYE001]MCV4206897.1 hypothetical protein [Roseomonas sp. SXEYE001]